jgi:S-sulfo-L-cysteine synthase (3-phospho-L-serine-dependent)
MSEPRPFFIFIESNTSGTGAIFAARAYEAGFTPVLVSGDPPKYDFAGDPWLRLETCDTYNAAALVAVARKLAATAPIAGVFSSSEYFIARAAALSRSLGLPGPDPARIEVCRDKFEQRRTVTLLGIDDLGFTLAHTPAQAAAYASDRTGPVVVKPTRGSGSSGVKLCRNRFEAQAHAAHLLDATPGIPFLVEDYAPGREFSVEMFDGEVCGLVDKHLGPQPDFVEFGHDFPARVSADLAHRLGQFAKECVQALGITWGPAHVELRSDGRKIHLVEVNPRLAGGFIPTLIEAASGLDLIAATIARAAGRVVKTPRRRDGCAALRFIVPTRNGVLVDVSGLDKAKAVPGIVSARFDRKLPLVFETHHDFRDRVGHLIAVGRDQDAAITAVEHAISHVSLGFGDGMWATCHQTEEAIS